MNEGRVGWSLPKNSQVRFVDFRDLVVLPLRPMDEVENDWFLEGFG